MATHGPIPNANIKVPKPTTPPRYQPKITTLISITLRTVARGRPVFLWKPVIRPSLGPGPKLAIKYIPPPTPVTITPSAASAICRPSVSNTGKYGADKSRTKDMMIIFSRVPTPGFWRKGIHKNITHKLIVNVEKPMLQLVTLEKPCAKTVQGLTPAPDATSNASPNPNSNKPIANITTDINGGFNVRGSGELQKRLGIDFIFRNCKFKLLIFVSSTVPNIRSKIQEFLILVRKK